jgi:hypothetical protein
MASELSSPPNSAPRTLPPWLFTAWAIVAAFGTYFCVYAFRRPFTAAKFEGISFGELDYKTLLVTAQVIGYTISKFIGIKVISEMRPQRRTAVLLSLIAAAQLALLGFAVTPAPYGFVFLFLNGLPLGMAFGLVLGFLEGRTVSEALTAGLCASFILADGATRGVGRWLLGAGVTEAWMPFVAGGLFIAPLLSFVWMLSRVTPPDASDVAARSARVPMTSSDRWRMFRHYAFGLSLLIVVYLSVTILRSMRGDFAPEIWSELGLNASPSDYATSEIFVGLAVVLLTGVSIVIRNNRRAFFVALLTAGLGPLLILLAVIMQGAGTIAPYAFMVLVGLGLYLPYVAIHTTIYERLIAMTRERGNMSYLMYLTDAFGYLGYVAIMIVHNFVKFDGGFVSLFVKACWLLSIVCLSAIGLSWVYFARRTSASPIVEAASPLDAVST